MDKNPNTEELLAALTDLAADLARRGKAYNELAKQSQDKSQARQLGKAAAYEHAVDLLCLIISSAEQAHAAKDSPTLQENHIGAAEREVGQFIYRRIERLMDAKPNTPELAELDYLSHIVSDVEEYGADGTEDRTHPFAVPTLQDEGVRAALERARDFITAQSPIAADEAILQALDALSRSEAAECFECGEKLVPICPKCNDIDHHHEAGGAPGREEIARIARNVAVECVDGGYGFTMEFNASPRDHEHQYDRVEEMLKDALVRAFHLAPSPSSSPSDQQGREQVIGELCEALEGVIAVADRKTVEFDKARAALAKARSAQ